LAGGAPELSVLRGWENCEKAGQKKGFKRGKRGKRGNKKGTSPPHQDSQMCGLFHGMKLHKGFRKRPTGGKILTDRPDRYQQQPGKLGKTGEGQTPGNGGGGGQEMVWTEKKKGGL